MANRSLSKRIWYDALHVVFRVVSVVIFSIRCRGRRCLPRKGGALLLSNHQSHLDPILIGLASDRRLNFVARETLFRFAPFRWLIRSLDAIPIDREGSGLGGLRETLKRLKRDEVVLIFPEGTRSRDGTVGSLKPGFCALARRAGVPLVPVAIDGAFDAWPRWCLLPRPAVVNIQFGPPILPATIATLEERELLEEVEQRIRRCHHQAQAHVRRARGLPRTASGQVPQAAARASTTWGSSVAEGECLRDVEG